MHGETFAVDAGVIEGIAGHGQGEVHRLKGLAAVGALQEQAGLVENTAGGDEEDGRIARVDRDAFDVIKPGAKVAGAGKAVAGVDRLGGDDGGRQGGGDHELGPGGGGLVPAIDAADIGAAINGTAGRRMYLNSGDKAAAADFDGFEFVVGRQIRRDEGGRGERDEGREQDGGGESAQTGEVIHGAGVDSNGVNERGKLEARAERAARRGQAGDARAAWRGKAIVPTKAGAGRNGALLDGVEVNGPFDPRLDDELEAEAADGPDLLRYLQADGAPAAGHGVDLVVFPFHAAAHDEG